MTHDPPALAAPLRAAARRARGTSPANRSTVVASRVTCLSSSSTCERERAGRPPRQAAAAGGGLDVGEVAEGRRAEVQRRLARPPRPSSRTRRGTPRRCAPGRPPAAHPLGVADQHVGAARHEVGEQLHVRRRRAPGSATPCPRPRCPRPACPGSRPARGARRPAAAARARTSSVSSSSRHGGAHSRSGRSSSERWSAGGEVAQLVDLVAPELHPHRVRLGGREDVEQATADGELAALLDQLHPGVGGVGQRAGDVVEVGGCRPGFSSTGTRSPRPGRQRLQHAAHRARRGRRSCRCRRGGSGRAARPAGGRRCRRAG